MTKRQKKKQFSIIRVTALTTILSLIYIYVPAHSAMRLLPFVPVTYERDINQLNFTAEDDIAEIVELLGNADGNDTVILNINSPGGLTKLTLDVVNALLLTEAKTISMNQGQAYSGGALISAACKIQKASPLSAILFHRARYLTRNGIILVSPKHPEAMRVELAMEILVFPHLTKKERAAYEAGEDVTFTSKDWISRITKK